MNNEQAKLVVWFNEIDKDDIRLVGGKGANLGEMVKFGFPVPPGFIVTSWAYFLFLKDNDLSSHIVKLLKPVNVQDPRQLESAAKKIRSLICHGRINQQLAAQIVKNYEKLGGLRQSLVAIRSSATAEDLPDASFAGQQETYLNVKGEANVVNKVRQCWASLFTPRAIYYRQTKKFSHFKIGIAVVIQKMIQSQTSGIMFTLDPVNNDKKKIIIEAIYGLGELIVQGAVKPDHYEIDKQNFKILIKQINSQETMLEKIGLKNKTVKVSFLKKNKQKINDQQIVVLAKLGRKIHQHYFFPQDIEWAIEKGKIFLVQTRPVTTLNQKSIRQTADKNQKSETNKLILLIKGDPASPGIASGFAQVIKSAKEINKIKLGEILITQKTTPDFVPAMKKAGGIITDQGGQTSHAAIVSRELGVPCIVGTERGTKLIKTGVVVTMNGKTGEVFKGTNTKKLITNLVSQLPFQPSKPSSFSFSQPAKIKTATKLYLNLGEPDLALEMSKKDVDGVGLLRAEFMISEYIKYHPKKLIEDKKQSFFIDKLSEGLVKFCQAFSPRPVVYRTTDFKTNEYRNLIGGKYFEPFEENPLLGFRGAYRYLINEDVFALEIKAIKKVRNEFGFKNLFLMIPFVRSVKELLQIKRIISSHGLIRSPSFQLWLMVEIPANVILLEDFIKAGIDGVSIGSNDLTMLMLGIDRDNKNLAPAFNELDESVLWALEKTIKTCLKNHISSSICGQAPSVYPDLTYKLVDWGITSISVSPDMIDQARQIIYDAEKRRCR